MEQLAPKHVHFDDEKCVLESIGLEPGPDDSVGETEDEDEDEDDQDEDNVAEEFKIDVANEYRKGT